MCEIVDKEIKAEYFPIFNGDKIPLCKRHYNIFKKEHLSELLDEQPNE